MHMVLPSGRDRGGQDRGHGQVTAVGSQRSTYRESEDPCYIGSLYVRPFRFWF